MAKRDRKRRLMLKKHKFHLSSSVKDEKELHYRAKNPILRFYFDHYRILLILPIALLLFAIIQISLQLALTGDFINKGVSLKGGLVVTVPMTHDIGTDFLRGKLSKMFPGLEVSVRVFKRDGNFAGYLIESDAQGNESDKFVSAVEKVTGTKRKSYAIEEMGASLGESFFKQTIKAMIFAFIFMGIVVFLIFRVPAPSFAVILAALSDILVTLAIVNLAGMKITTSGIAAFLMLIGYSVDTDILLSTKVIKRRIGSLEGRMLGAMKTGLTMSATTIAALLSAMLFAESEVLVQIMTILLIGLVIDLINTWIQNAAILRLYLERVKNGKG